MEHIFYLANVLGVLSKIFTLFFAISFIAVIVLIIGTCINTHDYGKDDEDTIVLRKWAIRSSVILVVSLLGHIFTPDKDTYLLMKGGQIVDEAYKNSSDLQELPKNTAEFLNEYVKTLTKELKEANPE